MSSTNIRFSISDRKVLAQTENNITDSIVEEYGKLDELEDLTIDSSINEIIEHQEPKKSSRGHKKIL